MCDSVCLRENVLDSVCVCVRERESVCMCVRRLCRTHTLEDISQSIVAQVLLFAILAKSRSEQVEL